MFLAGSQGRVEKQLGHTEYPAHRGPNFMAHIGQELGFSLTRQLGRVFGLDQRMLRLTFLGNIAECHDRTNQRAVLGLHRCGSVGDWNIGAVLTP